MEKDRTFAHFFDSFVRCFGYRFLRHSSLSIKYRRSRKYDCAVISKDFKAAQLCVLVWFRRKIKVLLAYFFVFPMSEIIEFCNKFLGTYKQILKKCM